MYANAAVAASAAIHGQQYEVYNNVMAWNGTSGTSCGVLSGVDIKNNIITKRAFGIVPTR